MHEDEHPLLQDMPPEFQAILAGVGGSQINWRRAWMTAGAICFLGFLVGYWTGRADGKAAYAAHR